jgi:PEP-CTERM motif
MNTKKLILSGLVALSLAAIGAQAAVLPGSDIGGLSAASQPGDLVVGFRNPASTSDFVIDIGQFSAYEGVAPGTYQIGGYNSAELLSVFPTAFTTSGTQWTVFGGTGNEGLAQPNSSLWISSSSTLSRANAGLQGSLSNTFDTFVSTQLASSTFGGASDATALSNKSFSALGSAGGYNGAYAAIESTTVGSTSLKLWELLPGSGAGTLLGTFNLDSVNGLTFTVGGAAIPEPSTYAALLGVVTLGIVAIRRRRQASSSIEV